MANEASVLSTNQEAASGPTALHAFVGYGVGGFYPAFLMRSHHMTVAQVGNWLALITALGGFVGTYYGGFIADRLSNRARDPRHQLWVPGISILLSVPIAVALYLISATHVVLWMLIPTTAIGAMYLGPTFAITQRLVGARDRALAGAIMLLAINFIGLGLGPLLTGMFSDAFKARFSAQGVGEALATAEGLRWALCAMTGVNIWSALHYMRAARSLREDLLSAASAQSQPMAAAPAEEPS